MTLASDQSVKIVKNRSFSERIAEYVTPKVLSAAIASAVAVLYMGHRYIARAQNRAAPGNNFQNLAQEAAAVAAAGLGAQHAAEAPGQNLHNDVEDQNPHLETTNSIDAILPLPLQREPTLTQYQSAPRFDPQLRARLEQIAIYFVRHFAIDGAHFDTRIFRERLIRRFPALILEFLDRAHEPLVEARIRALYQGNPRLDSIFGAPVILFAQNHIDYESVANNYALTFQLFTPETLIFIEAYLQHEELELLPLVLGQLAFIEHHLEHPELEFGSAESRELRALYTGAARGILLRCTQQSIRVPFADIRARGWDSETANVGERNRGLRSVLRRARTQSTRVLVHVGAAHAPAFSITRVAARTLGPMLARHQEGAILTTEFLRESLPPEILRTPIFDEVLSIVELQESFPPGHLELLPLSLESTIPSARSAREAPTTAPSTRPCCAFCKQPASAQCSGCKKVHYCDRNCQSKDWNTHKALCNSKHRK